MESLFTGDSKPHSVCCVVCCSTGKEYSIGEVVEAGDFKRCAEIAFKALEHDKDCGQPKVTKRGMVASGCCWAASIGESAIMRIVVCGSNSFWPTLCKTVRSKAS